MNELLMLTGEDSERTVQAGLKSPWFSPVDSHSTSQRDTNHQTEQQRKNRPLNKADHPTPLPTCTRSHRWWPPPYRHQTLKNYKI